jgi:prepilin-type N-terminal cleavage/methylation domain-containing protein
MLCVQVSYSYFGLSDVLPNKLVVMVCVQKSARIDIANATKSPFIKGFTLIELLVVIVIIGILATISVAQFASYQAQARDAQKRAAVAQIHKLILSDSMLNDSLMYKYLHGSDGNVVADTNSVFYSEKTLLDLFAASGYIAPTSDGETCFLYSYVSPVYSGTLTTLHSLPQGAFVVGAWLESEQAPLYKGSAEFIEALTANNVNNKNFFSENCQAQLALTDIPDNFAGYNFLFSGMSVSDKN